MHRGYVVRIILFVVLGIIAWNYFLIKQLYHIQVERHDELLGKARILASYTVKEEGRRGSILDKNGKLLASDLIHFEVSLYKPKFKKVKNKKGKKERVDQGKLIEDLNTVFTTPASVLKKRLKPGKPFQIIVAKEVKISLYDMIQSNTFSESDIAKNLNYPSLFRKLDFRKTYSRFYPNDRLLSHVIGYQSFDEETKSNVGRIGIEKAWNESLKPKKEGEISYLRGAKGNIVRFSEVSRKEPVHGSNVYLTVREPIQNIIETELKKLIDNFDPKSAYIMMANPKTGAILGMAQYPNFNLNDRSNLKQDQLRSRMLLDYFDPGSTMKGVSIAAALDAGVVQLHDRFYCEKGYWGRWKLKDSHPNEYIDVATIIQESSNIGTAKVAMVLGKTRLWSYLRKFGFGLRPQLGLGQENPGQLLHPRKWWDISITRIPMGQGISVTAAQMLQAYCALANDGVMMQLYAVDRVEDPNNESVKVFQPKLKRRVISSETTQKITQALSLVTQSGGTARRAAIDGINVAGKTGTSQKVVNGRYSHSKYVASFIGFLPAENPEFVLMVVADEPKKSHYGGVVAAPTFKNIAVETLKYIQMDPLEK